MLRIPFFRRFSLPASASIVLLACWIGGGLAGAQEPTPRERQTLRQLTQNIDRAGRSYTSQRFEDSAKYIARGMEQLEQLLDQPRSEILEAIKEDYGRLAKAHELLTQQGQTLPKLPELPAAAMEPGAGGAVSFRTQVAPILIAKCGNCHVRQSRGDFSAASFQALVDSTMIAFGMADDSRLIEVIENGEMPKGGLTVDPAELATLKSWIQQGAKFDGPAASATANLATLTGAAPPANNRGRRNMTAAKPTGKETVSFGLDIAPVLLKECSQCHITRQPRGNFSMANFRSLLRGGDSGNPIEPGKSGESNLIKRLRGDNAEIMPPFGKLDDEVIQKIATWIDEGAAFDGPGDQIDLETVAATVRASSLSHDVLVSERADQADKTWKLVMGDLEKTAIPSENVLVMGLQRDQRLEEISKLTEELAGEVADALRAGDSEPLVKGNISVFVFDKRYDFSEFGRMVEQFSFPSEITSRWGYTTVDAYATVLLTRNQEADDAAVDLVQQLAALHVASQGPDIPRWFADGVGLVTAQKVLRREERLADLEDRAVEAAAKMQRIDDFVANRMPADQAGLVAYLFVKQLQAQSAGMYGKLMKALGAGESFEGSFKEIYGQTPAEMLNQFARRNRR